MSRVVVLGGTGFAGSALCKALAASDHAVTSVARSRARQRQPGVNYFYCTYDNFSQLEPVYHDADLIIHMASDTTPGSSRGEASLEISTNLLPTMRLLEYLEGTSDAGLVFISSGGTVYGNVTQPPKEDAPLNPIAYHGAGKASIEMFLRAYNHQCGNPVIVLRPSNLYGPGQQATQHFGVVAALFECLLQGKTFQLMGDGSVSRDFLYIEDFVGLCVKLVNHLPFARGRYETLNIGSGLGCSVTELISLVQQVSGRALDVEQVTGRQVDVRDIVLDSSRALEVAGWAVDTPLERGLSLTWDWLLGQ